MLNHHATLGRNGKRGLVAAFASAILLITSATPAQAWSTKSGTLCGGDDIGPIKSYSDCRGKGYSDFGYEANSGNQYWLQAVGHNCTNYVAYRLVTNGASGGYGPFGSGPDAGAKDFGPYFTSKGFAPNATPAVGAIAWFKAWSGGAHESGHVAYVEKINTDGSIVVSEDNYAGSFDWRTIARGGSFWPSGFIHLKDVPTVLPAKPVGLKASSITGSAVALSWADASNNEDGFESHYRIGTGAWVSGPSVGANVTALTITGLQPGITYTFQVGAKNSIGTRWSDYYTVATVSLPAQPAVSANAVMTGTTAALTWTEPASNQTGFVSQYRIGVGPWVAGPSVGPNSRSLTVSGLAPATSYTFQVGATNIAGTKWSVYVNGTTLQVLPAPPANPTVRSTTGTTAAVSWTDASNNEDSFVSQYRIGTGSWVGGPSVGANVTAMTIPGLQAGTTYTFQIGARNSVGTRWSVYFSGATVALPAEPVGLTAGAITGSTVVLTWTDASNNEDSFVSQYRIGTGAWAGGPSVRANVTSMTIPGLQAGTTYTFQIGAKNSVGTRWSAYYDASTVALPAQPVVSTSAVMTSTTAVLTWTEPSSNQTGFVSQYRIGTGAWVAGPSVGASSRSITITRLAPATSYTFQVGATNIAGTRWSTYINGSTSASPPPPPPPTYHAGRQVTIDSHATGGVSGHTGPGNSYATGPTRPMNSALWIVCYVNGQSITGPYGATTIWDLSDDGYYYTDAWLYTGSNGAVVPACAARAVTVDGHANGGVSGHTGPDNSYAAGPTRAMNSSLTIVCYVNGQSITGPYGTTTIWDLSNDGYYYTDAWLYTGSNSAVVPRC